MKVRLTVPVETRPARDVKNRAPSALLRAGQAGVGAAVIAVTVAGCFGGGSPTTSVFTPSPQVTTSGRTGAASDGASKTASPSTSGSATGRASATDKASSTAKASTGATSTPTHQPTSAASATRAATPRPTVTVTHTSYYPIGAPQTGGGGTAGLQDVALFGAGAAAILAGFGSLAYRRRLSRKRRAEDLAHPSDSTRTPVP